MNRFSILTFNIAHGRGRSPVQGISSHRKVLGNVAGIARLIQESGADIVAMQEVDFDSSWNRRHNLLSLIAGHCGLPEQVMGVNTIRDGRFQLNYGNALLTRLPVAHWQNHRFGNKVIGEKGFLYCELALPGGGSLPVVNLHLHPGARSKRLHQIEQLLAYLDGVDTPSHHRFAPIICGDFNASRRHIADATIHLWQRLSERHSYTLLPSIGKTYPSFWPRYTLDFVLLPPGFHVHSETVLATTLSDHRPVLVHFDVPVITSANA